MPIVRKRKPDPPKPPTPPTPPAPEPITPAPAVGLGAPTGIIGGPLKIAFGRGGQWSRVNRWDEFFLRSGGKHRVLPSMLKAMAVIESGGEMIWNQGGSGAYGIMQIKVSIWGVRAQQLGYDPMEPEGQIGMAAAMLGGDVSGVRGNTPEERFLSTYYPTAGLDVPGEDGHTPRQYLADMHELMRQIDAAAGGTTPPPKPQPAVDLVSFIVGGKPTDDSYGFKHPTNLPYYDYFNGHGGNERQHPGIDASTALGQRLFTPVAGTVVCGGTGNGPGAWGTGCAAFSDVMGNRAGRVEILAEDGRRSLLLGHCSRSLVQPGAKVVVGQPVAEAGGYNGLHVHIEARVRSTNDYTIVDPRATFAVGDAPLPTTYAERIPVPQPDAWESGATVTVTQAGVPLLQRASKDSAHVDSPWEKGDTFEAVMLVWSEDERTWYWITKAGTRVPLQGTACPDGPKIEGVA